VRRRLDVARPYLWAALAAAAIGVGFLLAQLQSSDAVTWTGPCVPATLKGGIAFFSVNGQTEAVNDPAASANHPTTTVTVCYDPAHPEQGLVVNPLTHAIEGALFGVPLLTALVLLVVGLVIRPRHVKDIDAAVPWQTKPRA
jgi:hypothetical protein